MISLSTPRLRFAPSPTGFLHIGNTRAALFNFLYAKKHKGAFILRLDDTDKERSKQEYIDAIHRDLAWLGIEPRDVYQQSKRFDLYNAAVEKLKNDGRLYPCYETAEDLDMKRKLQLARKEPPLYDRESLRLTPDQIQRFEAEGRRPHWRFKLADEAIEWEDLIRGPVHFEGKSLSDPVLMREDGSLLYSLASVVDDIDMGITHIIRGEDHVTNTATHVQLFKALGHDPSHIHFAHTSLLVDASGQGFSKRMGSLSLNTLKEQGIQPQAICALLARLGSSLPIEPIDSLDALAETFDFSTLSRAPSKFDKAELDILNSKILHHMSFESIKDQLPPWMNETRWSLLSCNIDTIQAIEAWADVFQENTLFLHLLEEEDKAFIQIALDHLPKDPIDEETWGQWTASLKEITGRKGKALFMPLRLALTGKKHGPEMRLILPCLGRKVIEQRLTIY
jgi:glutamyl-tRNA synthetase